jgi:hypothetical protein
MQGLGLWVATQRETYKFEKESMPIERIDALEQLQFSWNRWGRQRSKSRKDAWDKMFHELIEYKNVSLLVLVIFISAYIIFMMVILYLTTFLRLMETATSLNMMKTTSSLESGLKINDTNTDDITTRALVKVELAETESTN